MYPHILMQFQREIVSDIFLAWLNFLVPLKGHFSLSGALVSDQIPAKHRKFPTASAPVCVYCQYESE